MMTRTKALPALTLLAATLTACSGDGNTPDAAPPSPSATTSPSPSSPPSPSPTTEEPTPLPTGDPWTWVYEVKGTAGAAWISYTGTDGERRLSNVSLPWRTEIDD